ncbi:MAG: GNAT family N-acetyltransferase [Cyclobacteriaceae bacterium]|nr:GNAT family N-acetyltransferase [Cyclobacteriaceae bacterium]UYN86261.1 MAG: GNAT family N-acetyltransferase [Cyclobacteriaceae bacterium]
MNDYHFTDQAPPADYREDFKASIFHDNRHLKLQAESGWRSFYVLNQKHKTIQGAVHVHVKDHVAVSPLKASFGSFAFTGSLPAEIIFRFIGFVENALRALGIKQVVYTNPPIAYQSNQLQLLYVLLSNAGYQVQTAEAGAVISVSDELLDTKMDDWEVRKLKQAREAEFVFTSATVNPVDEIFQFILNARKEKGYTLSMTQVMLERTVEAFPSQFVFFEVMKGYERAAASIAIRVMDDILYNFYSAHHSRYDAWSPVVMLIDGMYGWCQHQRIRLLDLGTSALDNQPNFSLLDFKLRLGAHPTAKLTFTKDLA